MKMKSLKLHKKLPICVSCGCLKLAITTFFFQNDTCSQIFNFKMLYGTWSKKSEHNNILQFNTDARTYHNVSVCCKLREIYCIISLTCGKTHLSNFASTQKTSLTINEENLRCFISLLLTLWISTSACFTWCGLKTHHLACKPLLSNITFNHHRSIPNPISNAHGYICTQGIVYPMLSIFNS